MGFSFSWGSNLGFRVQALWFGFTVQALVFWKLFNVFGFRCLICLGFGFGLQAGVGFKVRSVGFIV